MTDYKEQTTEEIYTRIKNNEDIQIIDVREDDEWVTGHIREAHHIRLSEIPDRLGEFDKSKEIVLVCRSGGRSGRACEYLTQVGYQATNMQGGMLKWSYDLLIEDHV